MKIMECTKKEIQKKKPKLFGSSVAISNNIILVGSPGINQRGKVYPFRISTNKSAYDPIVAYDGHDDDGFGISCDITNSYDSSGSVTYTCIIGAHRYYENSLSMGAAYIYASSDGELWTFDEKLYEPIRNDKTFFGCSVSIYGNTCIIGAYGNNTRGWKSGAAYIYTKTSSWVIKHSLFADSGPGDYNPNIDFTSSEYVQNYYGFSVSINEKYALVGSPGQDNKGRAFGYSTNDSWESYEYAELGFSKETMFGFSVGLSGDIAVVGSPGRNGLYGMCTTFKLSNLVNETFLFGNSFTTQSLSSRSLFGRSVAISDDKLIVGGYGKNSGEENVGSAFLFLLNDVEDNYIETPKSCLRNDTSKALFAHDVAISNDFCVLGDPSYEASYVYITSDLVDNPTLERWVPSDHVLRPSDFYAFNISIVE